jgi:hypothetical protein
MITDLPTFIRAWLDTQSFTPKPRILLGPSNLPAAAYPCIVIVPDVESFTNGGTHGLARLKLRVECAAGRPADAQAQARSLAQQLRAALHKSHALGGAVKHVRTDGIVYEQRADAPEPVAVAELAVEAVISSQ